MDLHAATDLICTIAAATAVARLTSLNLVRRFSGLVAYVVSLSAINLVFGLSSTDSNAYFWTWLVLEPVKYIFSVIAVRELFALAFDGYPGIRTGGRWAMYIGVAASLLISLLLTGFFWQQAASGRAHSHLFYVEVAERSIVFTLALVIVTILIFLSKYPLHVDGNTVLSSVFFSIVFLGEAAQLLIDSLAPRLNNQYVDAAATLFISACLAIWAFMLKSENEQPVARIRFAPAREEHLLAQLHTLNQLMTRSARR